jgi:molybdenum-dependent DNA-binding transcriptional regulator ModE
VHCVIVARVRSVRIARVTDVTVSGGKATGTAKLTDFTARVINRLAGKQVVAAGDVLGSATVSPTLK